MCIWRIYWITPAKPKGMEKSKKVVCFGEVLWDMLPQGKVAGGAPMNVAFQTRQLGLEALLISRVGQDDLGEELLGFLQEKGLDTSWVQTDAQHGTGLVRVELSADGQPSYEIVHPAAWDFIESGWELEESVRSSDLFVFGSLAARSVVSRNTLTRLLDLAPFRAFDINLRPPFYSAELILTLLSRSDLVKVNEEELKMLADWFTLSGDRTEQMERLQERFGWEGMICTLGSEGALYRDRSGIYRQAGFPISVRDTIGSGDAFLSAFLWGMLSGDDPATCLRKGAAAGAWVATQAGATSPLSPQIIEEFLA